MTTKDALTLKEQALISLGASVAAGCQPCTEHHLQGSRAHGACERGVALAIEMALAVRANATRTMDEWAARCQGARPKVDPEFASPRRLIAELVAVASAAAVNCVPEMQAHVQSAVQAGAAPEQVRAAIAVAQAIQRTAEQKVEAALADEDEAGEPCCAPGRGADQRASCGCR
jgi:AhpD family alkylhydroperoxidase